MSIHCPLKARLANLAFRGRTSPSEGEPRLQRANLAFRERYIIRGNFLDHIF